MDKRDWEIILAVYQEKNVSRAAKKLFVSQPALSYRLKSIEDKLDIIIFVKGKRKISFTKEGEILVDYARKMKVAYQQLVDELENVKNTIRGELRLGVSSNFADFELPEMMKEFHDFFPNIQLKVSTDWSTNVYKNLI